MFWWVYNTAMKLSVSTGLLLIAATAWGQSYPFPYFQPLSQLKDFLQLSDSQLQTILSNNGAFNQFAANKQSRIAQVQTEIAVETAKETLDPVALGVRYAEVESICRDMKSQAVTYQQRNTSVLTDPQRTKLQVLQDAMKLAPVISEGISGNLIGTFNSTPTYFTSTGSITGPVGAFIFTGYAVGCDFYLPVAGNIIPAGAFFKASVPEAERRIGGPGGGVTALVPGQTKQ